VGESLTYVDAVKILGHHHSRLVVLLDVAASVGLSAWATSAWASGKDAGMPLNLFELKNDVVRFGQALLTRASDWRTGLSRFDRTQRLAAAHAVLVVSAYFESLERADLPIGLDRLGFTQPAQAAQAAGEPVPDSYVELIEVLLSDRLPLPEYHRSYVQTRQEIGRVHARLAERTGAFVQELAMWDGLDAGQRRRMLDAITSAATLRQALACYDDSYRRLAADSREFAIWASLTEAHALGAGLAEVADLLASMDVKRPGSRTRAHLLAAGRSLLDEPLIGSAGAPEGVVFPPLREAYVNPGCRVAEVNPADNPADHGWWLEQDLVPDVEALLAGYLTSPRATQGPLVVLGEPGSGKSTLTEVLAARLADTDFLPIRVELRTVSAESMIQEQIEHAVYRGPGERVSWHELLEAADGALPVVILDGFDELLQASGVNRYDYLEQVRDFQRTQARIGHPVSVIVTSRTLVADRARFPIGTLTVRLEPFTEDQVRHWLAVWARHNTAILAQRGLRPLPPETALAHPELAVQPLLLMLLALFDATSNALQRDGAALSRAELYETLITDFALREVLKMPRNHALATARQHTLAERELHRLAIVALAMFSRRRQSVSAAELNRDLPLLLRDEGRDDEPDNAHTPAQRATGRFFFLHTAEASRHGQPAHSYEFLHATFGEFLTAWLTVRALRDLAAVSEVLHRGVTGTGQHLDDGFLYAALSFSCLAERRPTVDFLVELLRQLPDTEHAEIRQLLPRLLDGSLYPPHIRGYGGYEPVRHPLPRRLAAYSANLTLLSVLIADEELDAAHLLGHDPAEPWRRHTTLWHGQFDKAEWDGLIDVVRVRVSRPDGHLSIRLAREDGSPAVLRESIVILPPTASRPHTEYEVLASDPESASYDLQVPPATTCGKLIREMGYLPNWRIGLLFLQSVPLLRTTTDALRWRTAEDQWALPGLHLAELDHARDAPPTDRADLYRRSLVAFADHPRVHEQLLLRLRDEIHHLAPAVALDLLRRTNPASPTPARLEAINALWRHLSTTDTRRDPGARTMVIALVKALQRANPGQNLAELSPDLISAARRTNTQTAA
jgi:NACHT domain